MQLAVQTGGSGNRRDFCVFYRLLTLEIISRKFFPGFVDPRSSPAHLSINRCAKAVPCEILSTKILTLCPSRSCILNSACVTQWQGCIVGNVGIRFWKGRPVLGIEKWQYLFLSPAVIEEWHTQLLFKTLALKLSTMQLCHWLQLPFKSLCFRFLYVHENMLPQNTLPLFFPFYFLLNFKHIESAAPSFHLTDHTHIYKTISPLYLVILR